MLTTKPPEVEKYSYLIWMLFVSNMLHPVTVPAFTLSQLQIEHRLGFEVSEPNQ